MVIKIQPRNSIPTLRLLRLLFNRNHSVILVKFHHSVSLRVFYSIRKNHGPFYIGLAAQERPKSVAIKNIISQYQRNFIVTYKFLPYQKGLRQSVGHFLNGVL